MPLTFPSHAALPLPLKLWRPRWFDGVALVVGAASPDFAYALDGSGLPVFPLSHQWPGLFLCCLPVTLLCVPLVRAAAPAIAAHVPGLRAYGVLGTYRHPVLVTAVSALLAAASHQVWDRVTERHALLDTGSTVLGAVAAVAFCVHLVRSGLLRSWHGDPPSTPTRPGRFWLVATVVTAVAVAAVPLLPGAFLMHTSGVRLLAALALGLLTAAAASRLRTASATRAEVD
ncbi:DUF4184 family protein [Catellatospora tritici]|uniref:DUF4184 family protein n=1 Tax=Catellatospora tritici TaxID=2851566 RepID=UPI001C2D447C|nr:DUF4184 family protein [Catellatospora tritici]MBV1851207.1 DUF4184 family protein [Catellatospora tritici]